VRHLDAASRANMVTKFATAENRLILLDYDGTLVPFANEPHMAVPDDELLITLNRLAAVPQTTLVILSGRDRDTLGAWLKATNAILVAEHGGWVKRSHSEDWESIITLPCDAWKKEIRPLLNLYMDRIPLSFIEEKDFSLVWHYRKAENESASCAAHELIDVLSNLTTNLRTHVLPGNKCIEIRANGISKGAFFQRFFLDAFSFIFAAGDDWTDEDLFTVMPDGAFSIKVGMQMSKARYNVNVHSDIRCILHEFTEAANARNR
jgi:trehalose 6-phosphate synthase/phosphatase